MTRARLMMFSIVAVIAYTAAYYFDWSLFQYYLAEGRFHFARAPESAGPPILWYGWLAVAVLAGLPLALILPPGLLQRLPIDAVWLVALAGVLAAVMYELRWFF